MYIFKKYKKIIIVISIFFLGSVVVYYFLNNNSENNYDFLEINQTNEKIFSSTEDDKKDNKKNAIIVHIDGCVVNSGVYELDENSRIDDLIKKAGGLTEEADIKNLNLAYLLEDGMKIHVPSNNELEEVNMNNSIKENNYIVMSSQSNSKEDNKSEGGTNNTSNKSVKVNINKATEKELETLPGIGPSTALKIINYKKENGSFKSIEDIKNVKGIGESKYNKIKDLIKVK